MYHQGWHDRLEGKCRDLSKFKTIDVQEYSVGWLDAWKDEGFKKTQLGTMPVKQVVL